MGIFGFGPFSGANGQVQVPDLVGHNYNDVVANTLYKDFKITKNTAFSDTVPDGTIISQTPDKTIKIKPNGAITVVVSKGPLKANVPDTYGQNLAQAQNILDNAGFKSKSVNQYDPTTAIGMVISTDPQRGNSVPQSTVVTIYISQGPAPTIVAVPDLTNLSLTAAKSLLESKGLKIGTPTYQANALPKDTVLSQTPVANTPVSGGQAIQVVCSLGAMDANFDVNLLSGNYTIKLQIDGKYIEKYTYTSAGGVKSTITIPAGNYTNAHDVSIIVNDKTYKSFNYDFTLVQTEQMYEDNSDNGTDFNLISSVPSRPSSTSSTGSSKTTYGGSSYTTSVKKN
jgi:serine/threonine-protein kinase